MDEKNRIENRIGVLDGIRAIAIGMVVWFHFWQQTWLTPYLRIPTEYTKYIGITEINLAGWVRYGFVFVDMMILLSAFCNFYPYASTDGSDLLSAAAVDCKIVPQVGLCHL